MDYWVLSIFSFIMMLIYCALGGFSLWKFKGLLDPFIKSNITLFMIVFSVKPFFWLACQYLEQYNIILLDQEQPLVPIRSSIGSVISAMSFLILHIILFRIVLAYYLIKALTDEDRNKYARRFSLMMYIHVALYTTIVLFKLYFDYQND